MLQYQVSPALDAILVSSDRVMMSVQSGAHTVWVGKWQPLDLRGGLDLGMF